MRHSRFVLGLLAGLIAVLSSAVPAAYAAPRCFPEAPAIVDCIDGRIESFWEQQGGLPVFGYPLGPLEQASPGAPLAQRFERARLELHPENPAPYDVLLGRLGAEALARQGRDAASPPGDPAAPHFFAETGHAIAPEFWGYWSGHGLEFDRRPGKSFAESLALFGLPLSEAHVETNPTDGQPYLTQWFERARFEYHPENAGTPSAVLLGLLERELGSPPVSVSAVAPSQLAPGGFIQVSGSQLTRLGQPVTIKGVNYYPQGRPWAEMWQSWDGVQTERELRQARDQLGINAVRVLLPYNLGNNPGSAGRIDEELLRHMREMLQIAGSLNMRVIVALFDFYEDFPAAGSRAEARNLEYLGKLIGNFAGDDRILAWDVHNEPDHYDVWVNGGSAQVLGWLGRMADAIHRLAPNHLVTVGMGSYVNLLQAGPDGRRPIDYSDVVSLHNYNSGDMARQLDELRGATSKPLLLEEFGWPTGITCQVHSYAEDRQAQVYQESLAAATGRVAGVLAWTLRDFDSGPTIRWDSREEHYGLYRPDGSLKPAAEAFRAFAAAPLPSQVSTNLALTESGSNPISGPAAPLLIPETGHYVKGDFRRAWDLLGGVGSFGPPISEAFVRPGATPKDTRVVQYFAAAVLELHPEAAAAPNFYLLSPADQAQRLVVPSELGTAYAAGRVTTDGGHKVADPFVGFYRGTHGLWLLGRPITGVMSADVNGTPTTMQYFERGRLEWNTAAQRVDVSLLGRWAWDGLCSAPQ